MSDNIRPFGKINLDPVSAVIWRKETKKSVFYFVTFEKSYQDRSGKWQSSPNFCVSELLLVAKAADRAHDEIQDRYRRDQYVAGYVSEPS